MKRLFCLTLTLCLITSLALGQPINKKRPLWVFIPAFMTAVGTWYMAKNPPVYHFSNRSLLVVEGNEGMMAGSIPPHREYGPTIMLGCITIVLALIAVTPVVKKDTVLLRKEFRF